MPRTVMIVDDSNVMRMTLSRILKENGYNVMEAENGQVALDKANVEHAELIICDVNMPVMDGLTFAENLKKIESYKYVPVIMLTTVNSQELIDKGRNIGVKAWMVKPFEPTKLLGAVAKLLGA